MLYSTFTLGLWKRPWEGADGLPVVGVGRFESERFDPARWRPQYPWTPFARMDRFDGFWGAKIIVRFTPQMIRAAVEQGKYSDPRATDYLTRTLVERQHKLVAYWFNEVAPLDRFTVRDQSLCFDDLTIAYDVEPDAATTTAYLASSFDYDGAFTGWRGTAAPGGAGEHTACLAGVGLGATRDDYTIVRITPRRGRRLLPRIDVHLARGPGGALRVIGLRRH
jgi:hypothetical protein